MKAFLSLVGILLIVAGAKALVSCKNGVPDFDFDYEKWSGQFRYTMFQSFYSDGFPPADCQMKYWEKVNNDGEMFMNKTYRYFDGSGDVTDFFTGQAKEEGPGKWLLNLSQGDVYHIAMVETDYETYAAYVECNEDESQNYCVISSPSLNPISPDKITEVLEKFANLGADIENFELVVHDENCNYFIERH